MPPLPLEHGQCVDPLVDLRGVLAASKVHEHTAAPEVGLHEVEADLRQVRASIWEKRLVVFKDDDWLVPVPALRLSHRPEVRDAAGHPVGLNCSLGPHVGLDDAQNFHLRQHVAVLKRTVPLLHHADAVGHSHVHAERRQLRQPWIIPAQIICSLGLVLSLIHI